MGGADEVGLWDDVLSGLAPTWARGRPLSCGFLCVGWSAYGGEGTLARVHLVHHVLHKVLLGKKTMRAHGHEPRSGQIGVYMDP